MWIQLIAQVGIPLAMELMDLWKAKGEAATKQDILDLHARYGSMSADDYLQQAQAQAVPETAPVRP